MDDAVSFHTAIAAEFDARYERSPAFRERKAMWSRLIEKHLAAGGTVLDAGCGSGVLTADAAARAAYVQAFDGSSEMVTLARRRASALGLGNVDFRVGRFFDAGLLAGRQFDLVLCSSVLEYLDDWTAGLDWLTSALAPGGVLIFSLPNGDSLYRKAEKLLFATIGRPAFYKHIRAVPRPGAALAEVALRGLTALDLVHYGPAPLVSGSLRRVGLAHRSDTLFAIACRSAP